MFENSTLNLTGSGLNLTQILNIPPLIDEELNAVFSKSSVLNQQIVRETIIYLVLAQFIIFQIQTRWMVDFYLLSTQSYYVAEMQRYYQLNRFF